MLSKGFSWALCHVVKGVLSVWFPSEFVSGNIPSFLLKCHSFASASNYSKVTLCKICQNTGFLWAGFYCIRTESTISKINRGQKNSDFRMCYDSSFEKISIFDINLILLGEKLLQKMKSLIKSSRRIHKMCKLNHRNKKTKEITIAGTSFIMLNGFWIDKSFDLGDPTLCFVEISNKTN